MKHILRTQVERMLREKPQTRNSDISLWTHIVKEYHQTTFNEFLHNLHDTTYDDYTALYQFMLEVPNQDNVKRIRAAIQNDDKMYLPTNWKVAKERKWREEEWKEWLGYSTNTPSDYIERDLEQKHLRSIENEAQQSN